MLQTYKGMSKITISFNTFITYFVLLIILLYFIHFVYCYFSDIDSSTLYPTLLPFLNRVP